MSIADFSTLKRRARRNPEGPENLRLRWLEARVVSAPQERLLELINEYRERRFSIAEIDDFIEQQGHPLGSARRRR